MNLTDDLARLRIREDTTSTLFVEAGAGSGKTTALVDRICTLVLDDDVPLSRVAAVTFTEKAGAELRDRLRVRFQRETAIQIQEPRRARAAQALDDLDGAAIGTLHSFAQRILTEHPIQAGIPPLIEVLDEVGSSVAFNERWSAMLADLLDDDAMAEPLLLAMALGAKLPQLRTIAQLLGSDWDLIEEKLLDAEPMPFAMEDLTVLIDEARIVARLAGDCSDPDDKLLVHFINLAKTIERFDGAPNDHGRLAAIAVIGGLTYSNGKAAAWKSKPAAVDAGKALAEKAQALLGRITSACLRHLTRWIGAQVLAAADLRRAEGRLEFHDLLVLARGLLRRSAEVRHALHDQYQRLLLDEFQDTDPIQIELAVRIAGGADAIADRWQDITVPEGRLFVVGDPKQSIYRFRRASIATYLEAQEQLGETVRLTTNFRSAGPILDWVNATFERLIVPEPLAQPEFVALDTSPEIQWQDDAGPAISLLGAAAHEDDPKAEALRVLEAEDVAGAVRRVLNNGWRVRDQRTGEWRLARLTDIAILLPGRTSLPFLEDALEDSGIPYRAESSSIVYQAQEVRDLLAAARAVADPSDRFAVVTALRSPLFGCGDDDLFVFRRDGGSFNILAPQPEEVAQTPVAREIAVLKDLSFRSRWMSPSELLGALVADRRMFEVVADDPRRSRDMWRRLRFVIDQARAWSEASQGGLRAYLAWAAFQGEEGSRVAEAVLPETDVESVRIMTVHAAKGLEFPIVILSGMSSARRPQYGVRVLWTETGCEVHTGKQTKTEEFDLAAPIDEQMGRLEHIRLLYVAATRARDHLIVSLHRTTKNVQTSARTIAEAQPQGFDRAHPEPAAGPITLPAPPAIAPPPTFAEWEARTHKAQANAQRRRVTSASGLEGTAPELMLADVSEEEQGKAKAQRDTELPPWTKGRYGSAIGRAVHGVLQVVDLAAGPLTQEFAAAVQAQSIAEGVVEQSDLVGTLAASALHSDVVQRAAAREHWRETFVGTVVDEEVVEGFIDLLYRDDDGTMVVVDYKTDAVRSGAIATRVPYYRPQIEAYLRAIRDATGAEARGVLVFLHPGAALEQGVA